MAYANRFGAKARVFDIKVDSYAGQNPTGRLSLEDRAGEIPFNGGMQLILLIDEALANESCPDESSGWMQPPDTTAIRGGEPAATATFEIELLFRENYSWQGRMTWLEENKKNTFRSVLELLTEMDGALGG